MGINAAGYMFSQNVAYAIGSRTVLAIYSQLIAPLSDQTIDIPYRVITPKYALSYHNASPDLLQSAEGVYISEVYPNSAFTQLQSGDILATIQYYDVYTQQDNTADINAYGQITLNNNLPRRRRTMKEIFDTIPVFTPVTLTIWRQSQSQTLTDNFVYRPSTVRYPVYPAFTPYAYLVAAGYSIGELTYDHIEDGIISLNKYMKRKKRYQPRLVILQVLPQTTANQMQVFDQGTLLSQVNGVTVNTLNELRTVLNTLGPNDIISMVSDKLQRFDIMRKQAAQEDVIAARTLQMPSTVEIFLAQ
jgi:S1-C subfamily serine protease